MHTRERPLPNPQVAYFQTLEKVSVQYAMLIIPESAPYMVSHW